ncbi:hypothetical protein ACIO8F_37165 [Streptomyces sp. NPDC087228]|uniref:hypothetical protein n=1 Tax=Streptomyces sp. NPDC087228 TaxID=3365772 RepID=UPI0038012B0E
MQVAFPTDGELDPAAAGVGTDTDESPLPEAKAGTAAASATTAAPVKRAAVRTLPPTASLLYFSTAMRGPTFQISSTEYPAHEILAPTVRSGHLAASSIDFSHCVPDRGFGRGTAHITDGHTPHWPPLVRNL